MILLLFAVGLLLLAVLMLKFLFGGAANVDVRVASGANANEDLSSKNWWAQKRYTYNFGLVIAGFAAFLAYAVLGNLLIAPHDPGFEITLFTTLFQSVGYLIVMLLANGFYNLGYWVDVTFNKANSNTFRQTIFYLGFFFSMAVPFLAPLFIVIEYFIRFS